MEDVLEEDVLEPWPATAISNIGNIQNNWTPRPINNRIDRRVGVINSVGKPKRKKKKLTKQQIQQFEAVTKKSMRGGKRKTRRRKRRKNKKTKRKRY